MNTQESKSILLVEDDASTILMVTQQLKKFGCEVTAVMTGEKAVAHVAGGGRADLVLMDLFLGGGIDGIETAKRIHLLTDIPVVFHSSHLDQETVEKVRSVTRYGYVVKNSDQFVLQSSIEMAFELFKTHRQLTEKLSQHKRAEEKIEQSFREETALHSLAVQMSAHTSIDSIVDASLDHIVRLIRPDLALVFLKKERDIELYRTAPADSPYRHDATPLHRVGECLCGLAMREGIPVYSRNIHVDARCTWNECRKSGIRSFAALPLLTGDQMIGVIGIASGTEVDFERQSSFLEALSGEIALGLKNALLLEEVKEHAASLEQEVIERRRTTEELRRERDRAQNYLDTVEAIVVALDQEGRITLINRKGCQLLQRDEQSLRGQFWFATCLPQPDGIDVRYPYFKQLISGLVDPAEYHESRILDAAGNLYDIAWHNSLLRSTDGTIIGTLSAGEDITMLNQTQEQTRWQQMQLMQADKMASLGMLVSGIAHEINNPNNLILVNSELVSEIFNELMPALNEYYDAHPENLVGGLPYSRTQREVENILKGIITGSQRIRDIVAGLKDFARTDTAATHQPIRINHAVESALLIVGNLIRQSTEHFTVEYDDHLPPVRGNILQIEQVIINLLTNACQALPGRERGIRLRTEYDGEHAAVRVIVSDEGEGIAKENMTRLFDPFFTTKREHGGTGLGLSISNNIIKEHKGELRIESEAGKGTIVTVSVPVDNIGETT
jgi:PAS domain S-box-containing protein